MHDVPQALYARLRDEIRSAILDGKLRAHDRLPSENELSMAHGVSRITVRQALGDLQKEGLIVRLQGKGAFVSHPRASQSLNRLEGLGEALSDDGQAVNSKRLSMKRLRGRSDVCSQLELPPASEVYQLMTLRYLDREPLSVNCSYYPLPLGERMARLDLSGRDVIEAIESDLGLKVAQAQLEISAAAMPRREARWLHAVEGEPALLVHRVLYDELKHPMQIETATYRSDTFSYKLSLSR